ncbi:MAG: hypothetical protein EXR69_01425 [Myxococcales bacterium]|nr:hypothetical protein [Myxococcales bacterium]
MALAAVLTGPAIARGELVGSPRAETYGHAWVQAWTAEQWPAWPTGTSLAAGTADRHVIDPLPTWIAGGLARAFGLTDAWNLLVVGWIVLAALGGAALGRAAGLSPSFVAVGVVLSPIWRGSLWSGLTEDGAIGLVLLALALLWAGTAELARGPMDGSAARARARVLGAGILLGLSAWCGLYLAWFGAAAALGVGAWRAAAAQRNLTLPPVVLAAALAVGIALPAVLPFQSRLSGEGHRFGAPPVQQEPLWRVNPWRASDVASFVAPGQDSAGGIHFGEEPLGTAFVREHPTWIGYPTLALALVGSGPLTLPALGLAAWSVGVHPSVAGHPLVGDDGVTPTANLVARALDQLPLAGSFNHHARLWLLGQVACVVLAAAGIDRMRRRLWRGGILIVPLALAAVYADAAWLAPGPLALPGTSPDTPSIYGRLAELPSGPISVIGANGPGVHPQKLYFDQRAHGRALLANPDRPAPPDLRALPLGSVLVALGAPTSEAVTRATAALGEPTITDGSGAIWAAQP